MIALGLDSPPKVATATVLPKAWSKSHSPHSSLMHLIFTLSFSGMISLDVERFYVFLSTNGTHAGVQGVKGNNGNGNSLV